MSFTWQAIRISEHRFLSPLLDLYGDVAAESFTLDGTKEFSRAECDGIITIRARIGDRWVGVIYNDFRVNGGSFGSQASRRVCAFVELMGALDAPIVLGLSTLGVRIMEGRTVALDAFSVIPALKKFASRSTLITITMGRCLGIGALLFPLGHYRIGVTSEGLLNLAGPEVMRMFFGSKLNFDEIASCERSFQNTQMIHELVAEKSTAMKRARQLLLLPGVEAHVDFPETVNIPASIAKCDDRLFSLLAMLGDHPIEVFGQRSALVRAFLMRRGNRLVGVLINPPGNMNNMISAETIQKYSAALDFFKSLRIPAISLLDAPGIDPRVEQMDRGLLTHIVDVASRIIDYPYGLMGVGIGRGYGGSSVLSFPKFFGANRVVALNGAQIGIMHESIISTLFDGSPRLTEEWKRSQATETPDLADMIKAGLVDAVIDERELGRELDIFLAGVPVAVDVSKFTVRAPEARTPPDHRLRLLPAESSVPASALLGGSDGEGRFPH